MLKIALTIAICLFVLSFYSQVGLNTTGANPDSSAALDIDFPDKGILIPRLTTTQRDAINNPANSLLIFNKTTNCFEVFINNIWKPIWCDGCVNCIPCDTVPTNVSILHHPNPPCLNQSLTLMGIANGANTFTWTGPNGFQASGQNVVIPSFSSSMQGTYTLTASNNCGISSSSVVIVIGASLPAALTAIANPINVCLGDTLQLSSTGGIGANNWFWTGPNNFLSSEQTILVNPVTEEHQGVYTLTASNNCGSRQAQTSAVSVSDCPEKCVVIGSTLKDVGSQIINLPDKGFLVTAFTNSMGAGDYDLFMVRLDSVLRIGWKKTYGTSLFDIAYGTILDNQELIVTGITTSNAAGLEDASYIKMDLDGNIIWSKNYGGSQTEYYGGLYMKNMIKTQDNQYIHVGLTTSFGSGLYDGLITKFTSSGNVIWSKAIGRSYYDYLYSAIELTNGDLLLVGNIWIFGSGNVDDVLLIRTKSNGDIIWSKRFYLLNREVGFKIIQTSDNGFAIAGLTNSYGSGDRDMLLIKLDANGNFLWSKSYGGNKRDEARDIIQTDDNGFLLLGYTLSFGQGGEDVLVLKTDANGDLQWAKTIGGSGSDLGVSVVKNHKGEYVILGNTTSYYSDYDILLAILDSNGNSCCASDVVGLIVSSATFFEEFITCFSISGGQSNTVNFTMGTGGIKKRICE